MGIKNTSDKIDTGAAEFFQFFERETPTKNIDAQNETPPIEIPAANGKIIEDFSIQNRARQFFNDFDAAQKSKIQTTQTVQNDEKNEIDTRYFVFLKANNLTHSPENLRRFDEISIWLNGQSKPVSALPNDEKLRAAYNLYRRKYQLADSEELRRKFIKGYENVKNGAAQSVFSEDESNFLEILQVQRETRRAEVPQPKTQPKIVPQTAQTVNNRSSNDLRLPNGEKIKVSKDQTGIESGFVRVETEKGEKWLVNPKAKIARNESDAEVADTISVKLVSNADKLTVTPAVAKELYIDQVADALSKKYDGFVTIDNTEAINLPFGTVKDWIESRGLVDWQTKQPLANDKFYAPRTGAQTEDYHLTKGDLKNLAAFSRKQSENLENAYLKIVESGREPTADEAKYFSERGVNLETLQDKRYADLQLAQTKGAVAREDYERFRGDELTKSGGDETVANLKASRRAGWISDVQLNKGLGDYQKFRDSVRDDLYRDRLTGYGFSQGNWTGTASPAPRALPQKSDITEAEISDRIEQLRKYALSPQEIAESKNVAAYYNHYTGVYGSALIGAILNAGGRGMQTVAGVFRLVGAESPAIYLSKIGSQEQLAASKMGDDNSTVPYLLKNGTSLVLDTPRFILLSSTPLGAIGGFAIANGLESAGRGDTATQVVTEAGKGAMLGALFHGAGNLGKSVINRTFFAGAPKELLAGLSEADKRFLMEIASKSKGLPTSAYQRAIVSKVLGESTRLGTVFGGTVGTEKANGATNDEAFTSAAQMILFDLVMTHGGKAMTKITPESFDGIRNKLFRIEANGESKIVSVNDRNEIVIYKKLENLPKEIQDKLIDGTFVYKNEKYAITLKPTETNLSKEVELTQNGKVYGKYVKGEYLEVISLKKRPEIFGSNKITLNPKNTTTITGTLTNVGSVAFRGKLADGATKMGDNPGGINILRSPLWGEFQKKYMSLKSTNELEYWKKVTDEFWETANKPWLDEAIKRGDTIRFVSDPSLESNLFVTDSKGKVILDNNGNKIKSIFGREVDYLRSKGYVFLADGTAVRK